MILAKKKSSTKYLIKSYPKFSLPKRNYYKRRPKGIESKRQNCTAQYFRKKHSARIFIFLFESTVMKTNLMESLTGEVRSVIKKLYI